MLSSYWDDFPTRSPMGWRMPLQVQRKGGFFTDSLFQGTRNHFDSAIRDVMRSWDLRDTNDDFKSYRMVRDRQLSGTDRPSSLVEEDTIYKVVLDVQGFIENDLKVTFLNDNELVVEGLIEKKTEGAISRQSFKRRFVLAKKVLVDQATSALSSDNVLTITIPKQLQQITGTEQQSSTINNQTQAVSSVSNQIQQELSKNEQESKSLTKSDLFKSDLFDSSFKSIIDFPITRRSDFFGDSFFDNVRGMFQSRVQEIMNRRTRREALEDVNIFRSLRDKEDQNVAVTVAGDTNEHKIVLDVHGYSEGDLKVKAITETELLVEGKVERKTDNSCCQNSFRRNFSLPSNVNLQLAKSALSSDGVLTIIIPKKPEKPLPIEYSIPVTRDDQEHSSKIERISRRISESESKKEPVVATPIPMGYLNNQASNTQQSIFDTKSSQQISKECIIPVNIEGSTQQLSESMRDRTENTSLAQNTQAINSASTTKTETKLQESVQQGYHSTETDKSSSRFADQSWKDVQIAPQFNAKVVPINVRGSLCNDSIFDSARQRVESAVQNAMRRSTSREEQKTVQSSQHSLLSANKTATSTILDDVNNYKISLDVYGFSEKDLSIKIVSKNEISVQGLTESKKNGSITRHSFERTFHLPDTVNTETVTSDLSSEGMLTITLPKKKIEGDGTSIAISRDSQKQSLSSEVTTQNLTSQASKNTASNREYVVPLMMEGISDANLQKDLLETKQKTQIGTNEAASTFDSRSSLTSDFASEKSLNITSEGTKNSSQTRDIAIKSCFDLPIANKGHFYQDSFFNDSRDMFDSALRNSMNRFSSFSSFPNDLDFFNSLRQERAGSSEVQTSALSEDNQFRKVVVDVQGYPQDCLKVKVIEDNGIAVEGTMEEKAGCASSTRKFRQTFFLPTLYNVSKAMTALSSDGVLSIKIPKDGDQSFLTF